MPEPTTATVTATEPAPAAPAPTRYAGRRNRVRVLVAERGLDALLVSDLLNVRYLTGFTGSSALLVVGADAARDVFLTDPRYVELSARQVPDLVRVVEPAVLPAAARALAGLATVGVETHVMTVDQHETLRGLLGGDGGGGPALTGAGRPVEAVRPLKDDVELAALRRACAISVAALGDLLAGARGPLAGRTERAVAADLDALLLAHGADGLSFDTIVAAGENSASPHHEPTDRPLAPGDLVVVDFGALVDGYHADMTRTLFVRGAGGTSSAGTAGTAGTAGAEPAVWQREIHGLAERANAAGRAAAVPGASLAEVDAAARDLVAAGGYGDAFTHGLGHGVGLEIHEDPFLGAGHAGTLADGTPVTIEPGIYLSGRGGVRIEDTVLVGGSPDPGPDDDLSGPVGGPAPAVLTEFSRELLEVD